MPEPQFTIGNFLGGQVWDFRCRFCSREILDGPSFLRHLVDEGLLVSDLEDTSWEPGPCDRGQGWSSSIHYLHYRGPLVVGTRTCTRYFVGGK